MLSRDEICCLNAVSYRYSNVYFSRYFACNTSKISKENTKGEVCGYGRAPVRQHQGREEELAVAENGSTHSPRWEVLNFLGWLYCYSLFAAIVCSKHPEKAKQCRHIRPQS